MPTRENFPEDIRDYLNYITECIKNTIPVSAIYLFGSYAKGNYRENSDLDIYVVTPDKSIRLLELGVKVNMSFERRIRIPIDVMVGYEEDFFSRSKLINTLENEVATKGVNINAL